MQHINIYSDESRHLKNQAEKMVIGAVWCTDNAHRTLKDKVTLLKAQHGINNDIEIKWTKISPSKVEYYKDLIELFFSEEGLNFRAIVIPTATLRHEEFNQTADEFYYKMQYTMLSNIVRKHRGTFKIYLDYKDTWSYVRTQKLVSFLGEDPRNSDYKFIAQPIRSYESASMQIADLLIGAVSNANNEINPSSAKKEIQECIERLAGQKLTDKSPFGVDKFNLFFWQAQ